MRTGLLCILLCSSLQAGICAAQEQCAIQGQCGGKVDEVALMQVKLKVKMGQRQLMGGVHGGDDYAAGDPAPKIAWLGLKGMANRSAVVLQGFSAVLKKGSHKARTAEIPEACVAAVRAVPDCYGDPNVQMCIDGDMFACQAIEDQGGPPQACYTPEIGAACGGEETTEGPPAACVAAIYANQECLTPTVEACLSGDASSCEYLEMHGAPEACYTPEIAAACGDGEAAEIPPECVEAVKLVPACYNDTFVQGCLGGDMKVCEELEAMGRPEACHTSEIEQACGSPKVSFLQKPLHAHRHVQGFPALLKKGSHKAWTAQGTATDGYAGDKKASIANEAMPSNATTGNAAGDRAPKIAWRGLKGMANRSAAVLKKGGHKV
jgi:hypothetical protein